MCDPHGLGAKSSTHLFCGLRSSDAAAVAIGDGPYKIHALDVVTGMYGIVVGDHYGEAVLRDVGQLQQLAVVRAASRLMRF